MEYVEINGGAQLAEIMHAERRHRQDGYVIRPLDNGAGDGFGMTAWRPRIFCHPADMRRWTFLPEANQWRHIPAKEA